ncbi:MAG: sulfur carrier protein ThiS [Phycisphaerales bacterium]
MILTVNNKPMELTDRATVASLLRELGLESSPCAVEVNRELVPKSRHQYATLKDGDVVEIVTLVGGG